MSHLFKGDSRGLDLYNQAKTHYASVVPIRGKRAGENIRPIYNRTRTWERVVVDVRVRDGKEEIWYGYRLYETDVVMLSPTGIIEFKIGRWNSTATAQFIDYVGYNYMNSLFNGRKHNNKIWVRGSYSRWGDELFSYPIQTNKVVAFQTGIRTNEDGTTSNIIKPIEDIKEEVPVIDRKKMKVAMSPYMPMVTYLNAMVKLTGGLLSYDLRKGMSESTASNSWREAFVYKFSSGVELTAWQYYRHTPKHSEMQTLLNIAQSGTEEDWMKLLFVMSETLEHLKQRVGSHDIEVMYGDNKHTNTIHHDDITLNIKPTTLRERVAKWVKELDDSVWTSKIVNHSL
jgi:hypothetical protein